METLKHLFAIKELRSTDLLTHLNRENDRCVAFNRSAALISSDSIRVQIATVAEVVELQSTGMP